MTAASAFCGPTAAYLLSDAGSFDESGKLVEVRSKVIASSPLRIAAVMSGEACIEIIDGLDGEERYSPANDAAKLLIEAADQQEFLTALPDMMRDVHRVMEQRGEGFFSFHIALWNDLQHRAETYVIGSPGHLFPALPAFTLAGANPAVGPPVDRSLWPSAGLTRAQALAIIQEQRRSPWPDGTYRVGGFAELTTVDATGVSSETICRWHDRIGNEVQAQGGLHRCSLTFRDMSSLTGGS